MVGDGSFTLIEVILTMRPQPFSFMCGKQYFIIRILYFNTLLYASSKSFIDNSSNEPGAGPPELFTKMSILPNLARVSSTIRLLSSSEDMSTLSANTSTPCISISFFAFCKSSLLRAHKTILTPSLASETAHALPNPLLPPPIMATFPLIL